MAIALVLAATITSGSAWSAESEQTAPPEVEAPATTNPPSAEPEQPVYILEYRVQGSKQLSALEIGEAVYPFLGPGRTSTDVEGARAALEKAFKDKGFETVTVQIPAVPFRRGVVFLQVNEATVGRLRVKGSRYFLPSAIKERARSMAEGKVVNFNQVQRDILALNQLSDRTITPELRPGVEPGTVDIDLNVKDTLPLHGSIELNNRNSANTTALRLNASLSYNNLWQLGHSIGLSFQVAPQEPSEAKIFSGYYTARVPNVEWLSLTLQATKNDSNVSTLGAVAVAGRGEVVGIRAIIALPPLKDFYQSFNFGIDYKHFDQELDLGTGLPVETPITYYPITAAYSGTWAGKGATTEFNAGITMHLRGSGSDEQEFENSRFKADGAFIYLRGDLTHTRDLPGGLEVEAKVQGQIADRPLVSSEQYTGGGLGTVRGYLEAEAVGDSGAFGSIELRSPSLLKGIKAKGNEWRIYGFFEGGRLSLREPLPEQDSHFDLASFGFGSRLQFLDHFNASIDAGVPLISQAESEAHSLLLTFRVWADF